MILLSVFIVYRFLFLLRFSPGNSLSRLLSSASLSLVLTRNL